MKKNKDSQKDGVKQRDIDNYNLRNKCLYSKGERFPSSFHPHQVLTTLSL